MAWVLGLLIVSRIYQPPMTVVVAYLALGAMLAVMRLAQRCYARARFRWHRAGRCMGCGYDLRGLAQVDRCPECGQIIQARLARPAPVSLDVPNVNP